MEKPNKPKARVHLPSVALHAKNNEEWETMLHKDSFKRSDFIGRAYKWAKADNLLIFAEDSPKKQDVKTYIISSIDSFLKYFESTPPEERSMYSVLSEIDPCYGYYDLEFMKDLNPNSDVDSMTKTFLETLFSVFHTFFPEERPLKMEDFLILTSSNEKKASTHIHGPFHFAWKDVYHQRVFVDCVEKILRKNNPECFIKGPIGERQFFVDSAVYSHNRHFRLYKSAKYETNRFLTVDKHNTYPLPKDDKDILLLTIANAVAPDVKILSIPNQQLIEKVLPSAYYKRTATTGTKGKKECHAIFKNIKGSPENYTHFEETAKGHSYYIINDLDPYFEELTESLKKRMVYKTYQKINQNTKLIIGMNDLELQQSIDLASMIASQLKTRFKEADYLLLQSSPSSFFMIFPHVVIEKEEGISIVNSIRAELKEDSITDLYQTGFVPIFGAYHNDHQIEFIEYVDVEKTNRMESKKIFQLSCL